MPKLKDGRIVTRASRFMKPPELVYKKLPAKLTRENFPTEFFRADDEFAVVGPTWDFSPKVTIKDFRLEYSKKPDEVARDIGCRPTMTSGQRFCRNPNLVTERANQERKNPLKKDGTIEDWFRPGDFEYVAAYDIGIKRDGAGFCLAHYDYELDKVVLDLMEYREAVDGSEISFEELRSITYDLWDRGFFIACVVADTWQSQETRQQFECKGFVFKFVSVDRSPAPYETLLDLLVEDKLDYYPHPVFDLEFSNLLRLGRKIDHPDNLHKDLSDAVAAAVYTIMQDYRASPAIG